MEQECSVYLSRENRMIRPLFYPDLNHIIMLQDQVVAGIKDSSSYYPLSIDEVIMLLGEQGLSLGAFNPEEELIGYAAAYFPGRHADNLGLDLGFPQQELMQVAHLEAGIVHSSYRGQGWQSSLYQELIEALVKQKSYRYILSTVAPRNYPALRNSLRLKLYIGDLCLKYGNQHRYLLIRDLENPLNIDSDSIKKCRPSDIELQQELFRQGYYGFDLEYGTDEPLIYFGLKI